MLPCNCSGFQPLKSHDPSSGTPLPPLLFTTGILYVTTGFPGFPPPVLHTTSDQRLRWLVTGSHLGNDKQAYTGKDDGSHTLMDENSKSMYSLMMERWRRWKVMVSGEVCLFWIFRPNRTSSLSREKCGSCVAKPSIIWTHINTWPTTLTSYTVWSRKLRRLIHCKLPWTWHQIHSTIYSM